MLFRCNIMLVSSVHPIYNLLSDHPDEFCTHLVSYIVTRVLFTILEALEVACGERAPASQPGSPIALPGTPSWPGTAPSPVHHPTCGVINPGGPQPGSLNNCELGGGPAPHLHCCLLPAPHHHLQLPLCSVPLPDGQHMT